MKLTTVCPHCGRRRAVEEREVNFGVECPRCHGFMDVERLPAHQNTPPKERHGCLTAWLILVILGNAFVAVVTPLAVIPFRQTRPEFPTWVVWPLALLAVLNVFYAIALFRWQKWGFYGLCFTAVLACALNLAAGTGIPLALLGLAGVVILYGVLQLGGANKAWTQLQ
jgi:hypothetical protein